VNGIPTAEDALFVIVDGHFVCDDCGKTPEEHWSRTEVDGAFKGWTRYRCVAPE
jgi:hypothetical protein